MIEFNEVNSDMSPVTFIKYRKVMDELLSNSKCEYCEIPISEEYYSNENYYVCEYCSIDNPLDNFKYQYLDNYVEIFREDFFEQLRLNKIKKEEENKIDNLFFKLKELLIKMKNKTKK